MPKALLRWRGYALNVFSWTYIFKDNQTEVDVDQQLLVAPDGWIAIAEIK